MNEVIKNISSKTIQEFYEKYAPKGHFFSDNTMKFFDSIIYSGKIVFSETCNERIYFITSERYVNSRKFSIRQLTPDGFITTVGKGFCMYSSENNAIHTMDKLIAEYIEEIGVNE